MVYYSVVAKTSSWTFGQTIGFYQSCELAKNVAVIVSKSPMKKDPEGLVVIVKALSEPVIQHGKHLYFFDKSDGSFKSIQQRLSGHDILNFAQLTFAKPC